MRDGIEKFVVLPLFMGCVSPSSVQVFNPCPSPKKSKPETNSHTSMSTKRQEKDGERSLEMNKNNTNSKGFYSFPKPNNIALGIHKLIVRSSKTLSQLSVDKEQEEEEEEMEIGAPTDVKHITHIGIGECASLSSSTNNIPVECHAILFGV